MKLLVIGGGGREHALAWKLAQSPRVIKVYVAPGNAGTALEHGLENLPITAIPDLVEFAKKENIALTVVGPEAPLAEGVADAFHAADLKIFAPTKQAAQLEISKEFSKAFMHRHNIPTAAHATFSDASEAHQYLDRKKAPIVIKADGLAAGKGVIVATTSTEAHAAVDAMLINKHMGEAGMKIIIEDFLPGEEVSFIVMVDGHQVLPLATSQDYTRLRDGDQGPNTGGMGAYSPTPFISPERHGKIMREIIHPAVNGMLHEGARYTGFLYAGLMITPDDEIKVLEFNCRLGDPETQTIMMRLKSDLFTLIEQALNGTLDNAETEWDRRVALGVVMAAHGYPETPRKNDIIHGLSNLTTQQLAPDEFHVFHSGTTLGGENGDEVLTAGGRVLCITTLGDNIKMAQRNAYQIAEQIYFDGRQMRHDIGYRGMTIPANRASSL